MKKNKSKKPSPSGDSNNQPHDNRNGSSSDKGGNRYDGDDFRPGDDDDMQNGERFHDDFPSQKFTERNDSDISRSEGGGYGNQQRSVPVIESGHNGEERGRSGGNLFFNQNRNSNGQHEGRDEQGRGQEQYPGNSENRDYGYGYVGREEGFGESSSNDFGTHRGYGRAGFDPQENFGSQSYSNQPSEPEKSGSQGRGADQINSNRHWEQQQGSGEAFNAKQGDHGQFGIQGDNDAQNEGNQRQSLQGSFGDQQDKTWDKQVSANAHENNLNPKIQPGPQRKSNREGFQNKTTMATNSHDYENNLDKQHSETSEKKTTTEDSTSTSSVKVETVKPGEEPDDMSSDAGNPSMAADPKTEAPEEKNKARK